MSNKKRLKEIAKREKIPLTWHIEEVIFASYNLEMMNDKEITKVIKQVRRKELYGY